MVLAVLLPIMTMVFSQTRCELSSSSDEMSVTIKTLVKQWKS